MTVSEPEFSDEDRAQFFVDFDDEHQLRSPTGVPWDVAMDSANQGRFEVDVFQDLAAEAVSKKRAEYEAAYPDADLSSYRFVAVPPAE